ELGHFQRRRLSLLVGKLAALMLLLLAFGLAYVLSGRRALTIEAAPRTVLLSIFCSLLVTRALAPVSLAYARAEERFADRYALQLVGGVTEFKQLLLKVAQNEREPLDEPAWVYFWSASHPTFLERMANASKPGSPEDRH